MRSKMSYHPFPFVMSYHPLLGAKATLHRDCCDTKTNDLSAQIEEAEDTGGEGRQSYIHADLDGTEVFELPLSLR